jgi:hypothetical protein
MVLVLDAHRQHVGVFKLSRMFTRTKQLVSIIS